ncbi:MAG TPA: LD-carboxypeptidase [Desulfurivibrionaceae bacterium]|nr:LD-carboxypeptidase [Desulfurivibrionaceae bacterium]
MNATAKPLILPPPLRPGDTIGLVTPAGPVRDLEPFTFGKQLLEEQGFLVKVPDDLFNQLDFLAGSDQERALQFTEMWLDPGVQAVLAVRGGYGCLRLLPLLDLPKLAANPKILAGYSDLTVLLNEVTRLTGMVTFHAPVLNSLQRCNATSRDSFWRMLAGDGLEEIRPDRLQVIRAGRGRGPLIGGNLTSLAHLLGTPHALDCRGRILFLEDTGEAPYRIDRLLTHLERAGCLRELGGLILGTFTDGKGEEEAWSASVWNRVLELAGEGYPIWGDFPVGHGSRNLSLPLGVTAEMDSASGTLYFPAE